MPCVVTLNEDEVLDSITQGKHHICVHIQLQLMSYDVMPDRQTDQTYLRLVPGQVPQEGEAAVDCHAGVRGTSTAARAATTRCTPTSAYTSARAHNSICWEVHTCRRSSQASHHRQQLRRRTSQKFLTWRCMSPSRTTPSPQQQLVATSCLTRQDPLPCHCTHHQVLLQPLAAIAVSP